MSDVARGWTEVPSASRMKGLSVNRGMSTPTTDNVTLSPNHEYDRSDIHLEIKKLLNEVMSDCCPQEDNAIFEPLKGEDRKKYGDYVCFGVLEICEKLREKNPRLFFSKGPRDIAMRIMNKLKSRKSDMIKRLYIRDAGIFTFKLEGDWIAKRIMNMLNDGGVGAWAPILSDVKRTTFVFPTNIGLTEIVRGSYIKEALSSMFLYSGVDAGTGFPHDLALEMTRKHFTKKQGKIVSRRNQTVLKGLPTDAIYRDMATLWCGVKIQAADLMIYMTPHRLKEYIQQCHTAAAKEGWLPADWKTKGSPTCCGFRPFRVKPTQLQDLWLIHHQLAEQRNLFLEAGYTIHSSFECAFKFTCLKSHRLAECNFNLEDIRDMEGNFFLYLLKTQALVRSLIKVPGRNLELNELAGRERELGLHLVEFTKFIATACGDLMPNVVCDYLWDLCKLFMCYHCEIRDGEHMLGLCVATEVVMAACFDLLGIAPTFTEFTRGFEELFGLYTTIPSEVDFRNPYLKSRFEMFSMNVRVHSRFDKGTVYGTVSLRDTHRSAADGWVMMDDEDDCYVSYFNREWHNPIDINNGSYIQLGNPSSVHSIPFSRSLKVEVVVIATSGKKDETYLVYNGDGIAEEELRRFWDEKSKNTMCGTIDLPGKDGRVLLDYVAIKDAVDTTMQLTFSPARSVRLSGSIMASYGGDVLVDKNFLGQYNALIFKAVRTRYFRCKKPLSLPLHKSVLALPANGSLRIRAYLLDDDTKKCLVDDDVEIFDNWSSDSFSGWKRGCDAGFFELRVNWVHQVPRGSRQPGNFWEQ